MRNLRNSKPIITYSREIPQQVGKPQKLHLGNVTMKISDFYIHNGFYKKYLQYFLNGVIFRVTSNLLLK